MKEKNQKSKNSAAEIVRKVNVIWSFCILGIILIILLAFIISKRIIEADKLIVFVSNASLLLSIVLSIVAIFVSINSSHQTNHYFEKINDATQQLHGISSKMIYESKRQTDTVHNLESSILNLVNGPNKTKQNSFPLVTNNKSAVAPSKKNP